MDEKIIGFNGLKTAVNPLVAGQGSLYGCTNMVCDLPGWLTKRRGMKQLGNGVGASSGGWSGLFFGTGTDGLLPKQIWTFDDHIFLYVEHATATGDGIRSGLVAYDLVSNSGWDKVFQSTQYVIPNRNKFNLRYASADRRLLLGLSSGVYKISYIGADYYPPGSTDPTSYASTLRPAGIPRALDARIPSAASTGSTVPGLIVQTGYEWLTPNSSVAYRICWIRKDENGILQYGAPSGRTVVNNTNAATSYGVRLKFGIPWGVSDDANATSYVAQIYRTLVFEADATGAIPDPGDDMFLAGEYRINGTDLGNQYVLYDDISFDGLLGQDLYTNESLDGPGSERFQPPVSDDIAYFGRSSFFASTKERQRLTVKLLAVDQNGTSKGLRAGDLIVAGDLTMEAATKANEETQSWYFAIDDTTGVGSEVTRAIKTAESFVYKYNYQSNLKGSRYYAFNLTSNDDIVAVIGLEEKSIGSSTPLYVGITRADSPVQVLPSPVFTSTPGNTVALKCSVATNAGPTTVTVTTASAHNLTTGDQVYLSPYANSVTAGSVDSDTGTLFTNTRLQSGVRIATVTGANTFTFASPTQTFLAVNPLATDANTGTTGGYVHKIFDTTAMEWTHARSTSSVRQNRLMWSPDGEPECVPLENFVDIGSTDKPILRIVPTQDALFIFKEDGLWRLKGSPGTFELMSIDKSFSLLGPESPAVIGEKIYCYATNGVFSADESGVSKVSGDSSYRFEELFRSISSDPKKALAFIGAGHQEDGAYWLGVSQTSVTSGGADTFYRYHAPTKTWSEHIFSDKELATVYSCVTTARASRYTTFDSQAYAERLVLGASTIGSNDFILIERRTSKATEGCDADIVVFPVSFNSSNNTVTLTATPDAAEIGDSFLWYANATYVPGGYGTLQGYRATITNINGSVLTLNITGAIPALSSWPAIGGAMSAAIMKQIPAYVRFRPIYINGGMDSAHASELAIQFGSDARFSSADVYFYPDSNPSTRTSVTSTINGFGPQMNTDWTARDEATMHSIAVIRLGVPRAAAIGSRFLVEITNNRAFEKFDIAGIRLLGSDGGHNVRRSNS